MGEGCSLEVTANAAVRLVETASFGAGKQEPYLVLQAGNAKNRTDACKGGGRHPTWNQVVPLTIDAGVQSLQLAVWRASKMRRDELLGFGEIVLPSAAQLLRGTNRQIERIPLQTPSGQAGGEVILIFRGVKAPELRATTSFRGAHSRSGQAGATSFPEIYTGAEGADASIVQPGGGRLQVSQVPCYVGLNRLQQRYESSRSFFGSFGAKGAAPAPGHFEATDSTISHTDGSTYWLHAGKSGKVTAIMTAGQPGLGPATSSTPLPEAGPEGSAGSALARPPGPQPHQPPSSLQPLQPEAGEDGAGKGRSRLFSLPARTPGPAPMPPFPDIAERSTDASDASSRLPLSEAGATPAAGGGASGEAALEERSPSLFDAALRQARQHGQPLPAPVVMQTQPGHDRNSMQPCESPFRDAGMQRVPLRPDPHGGPQGWAGPARQGPPSGRPPSEDWGEESGLPTRELQGLALPAEPFQPPKGRAPKSPFSPSGELPEEALPPAAPDPRDYQRRFGDSLKPVLSSYEPWPQLSEVTEGSGEGLRAGEGPPGAAGEPGPALAGGPSRAEAGGGQQPQAPNEGRAGAGGRPGAGQPGAGEDAPLRHRGTGTTDRSSEDVPEWAVEGAGGPSRSSHCSRRSSEGGNPPVAVSPAVFSALSQLAPRIPELEEAAHSSGLAERVSPRAAPQEKAGPSGKEEEAAASISDTPPSLGSSQARSGLPVLLEQEGLIKRSDLTYQLDEKGRPITLGRGGFGEVFKGYHLLEPVAIKRTYDQERARVKLSRECAILKLMHSQYITQFIGACLEEDETLMVTELMDFSLFKALQNDRYTWFRGGRKVILDVARGLHYMHSLGLIHLDIKSANILLRKGDAKIGDFGMSQIFANSFSSSVGLGTFSWVAPEVLSCSSMNLLTVKVDIFSLGTLVWAVCTGEEPSTRFLRPLEPGEGPPGIVDLINWCHAGEPEARPSAADVVGWVEAHTPPPEPRAHRTSL